MIKMANKIFIKTFGCTLNQKNSKEVVNNLNVTKDIKKAELIIVNTCGVKEQTERKIIKYLKKLKDVYKIPDSKIIIIGCLVTINKNALLEIYPKARYYTVEELNKLKDFLDTKFEKRTINKSRFTEPIIISNGCLGNCSYCAVKFARGKLKSRPIQEIIKEIKDKYKQDSREFLLTAQDTACYGFDINTNIVDLLKEITSQDLDFKLRLGMGNPLYLYKFKEEIVELFKSNKIYKFLHIPIQSGSNKILKKMKRPYTKELYINLIKYFKENIKDITLATDIIVGFPSETQDDFKETVDVLKKLKFDFTFISRFGQRKNIEANKYEDMHSKIKKERSRELTKLCEKINLENNYKYIDQIKEIIINEKGKNNSSVGKTKEYKTVVVKKEIPIGTKLKVKISKVNNYYLLGEIIS
jgi:MiaB-like tRNA modifying enzyme